MQTKGTSIPILLSSPHFSQLKMVPESSYSGESVFTIIEDEKQRSRAVLSGYTFETLRRADTSEIKQCKKATKLWIDEVKRSYEQSIVSCVLQEPLFATYGESPAGMTERVVTSGRDRRRVLENIASLSKAADGTLLSQPLLHLVRSGIASYAARHSIPLGKEYEDRRGNVERYLSTALLCFPFHGRPLAACDAFYDLAFRFCPLPALVKMNHQGIQEFTIQLASILDLVLSYQEYAEITELKTALLAIEWCLLEVNLFSEQANSVLDPKSSEVSRTQEQSGQSKLALQSNLIKSLINFFHIFLSYPTKDTELFRKCIRFSTVVCMLPLDILVRSPLAILRRMYLQKAYDFLWVASWYHVQGGFSLESALYLVRQTVLGKPEEKIEAAITFANFLVGATSKYRYYLDKVSVKKLCLAAMDFLRYESTPNGVLGNGQTLRTIDEATFENLSTKFGEIFAKAICESQREAGSSLNDALEKIMQQTKRSYFSSSREVVAVFINCPLFLEVACAHPIDVLLISKNRHCQKGYLRKVDDLLDIAYAYYEEAGLEANAALDLMRRTVMEHSTYRIEEATKFSKLVIDALSEFREQIKQVSAQKLHWAVKELLRYEAGRGCLQNGRTLRTIDTFKLGQISRKLKHIFTEAVQKFDQKIYQSLEEALDKTVLFFKLNYIGRQGLVLLDDKELPKDKRILYRRPNI